jgi:type VI secretion system protein ImpB
MPAESIHQKLSRVRKPHVHITYEVETGGVPEIKELPFVVGVLGDFSGNPTKPLQPLADRKFISIDRDNFNDIMQRMNPGLNFRVENTLKGDGSEMAVQLQFQSIEDFEPGRVVDQVEPLKKLLETRNKLRDLLSNVDRSDILERELEEILKSTEKTQALAKAVGADSIAPGSDNTNGGS